jgi:serine/threonine-protein phosphatase 2B regulatory subunit
MLDGCNYRDFVRFLAAFSPRATRRSKAAFMFDCYDVDGDGTVSADDLRNMLHYLVAGHLSEEQVERVIGKCFEETGRSAGITLEDFVLHADTAALEVHVPQRL